MGISQELIAILRREFRLDWRGIHGVSHWARVRQNGLFLAKSNGANPRVVELFAFFHDVCRENEILDPQHGFRAAAFVRQLPNRLFDLDTPLVELLIEACQYHTDALTHCNITVTTCWDADRLDLGRVGILPRSEYLCNDLAKQAETIAWAFERSRSGAFRTMK